MKSRGDFKNVKYTEGNKAQRLVQILKENSTWVGDQNPKHN